MTSYKPYKAVGGSSAKILVISNCPVTDAFGVLSQQSKDFVVIPGTFTDKIFQHQMDEIADITLVYVKKVDPKIIHFVRELRMRVVNPLLLLGDAMTEDQVLDSYLAGIDEVISGSISPELINAKLRAWLRRTWTIPSNAIENIRIKNCLLASSDRTLTIAERPPVKLTNLELRLLHLLMSLSPRAIGYDEMIERVWRYDSDVSSGALKNIIYRLRQKIEINPTQPRYLLTDSGLGYRFVVE